MLLPKRNQFETSTADETSQNQSSNQNLQLKHIFFGFMGGFFFSSHFQPWLKYLWIAINSMLIILDLGGLIAYLILIDNKTLGDIFLTFFMINTVLIVTCFLPLFTYYFRNEYQVVIELNETSFDDQNQNEHVSRSRNQLIFVAASQFIAGQLLYTFIHLIFLFLIDEEKYLYDWQYYIQPTPLMGRIHTRTQYIYVWILQFLFSAVVSAVITSFTGIFMTTAHEFYVALTTLCSRMEKFSRNVEHQFSNLNKKYQRIDQDAANSDFARETEILQQQFYTHVLVAVRDFQIHTRKSQMMKQFVEFAYAMFLTLGFLNQCFFVYILSTQQLESFQKVKAITMYVFAEAILYGLCITGKMFDDMADMITYQVQDLPWYYMDSSRNKIVYLFTYLAQKPTRFFAFKMFPMGMNTFLQSVKITYTFYSVLSAALGR